MIFSCIFVIIQSIAKDEVKNVNPNILTDLVITRVNSVSTVYSPSSKKTKRDNRPCWGMAFKYEGETVYRANGKEFLSDGEHLVILPKGCSYEWLCTKEGQCGMIEFESDLHYSEPISLPIQSRDKALKYFKNLEYKRALKGASMHWESLRDLYSILLTVTQEESKRYLPSEKKGKIDDVIEFISQNFDQRLTNESLARVSGLSTVYFRKLFTRITGVSPISYVQNLRIEKAKEILKSDYGNLSDVALSLGYSSLYDFSRAFKKHTGISPSKYYKR